MNYLSNRPNYPFNNVKVPEGLEQMLSDITREVLKVQPPTDNTYDIIATYLEKMLDTRESHEVVETLLNRIINRAADIAQELRNDALECEKAKEVVEIIRRYFENFVIEKRKEKYAYLDFDFEDITLLLELINKCKLSEKEVLRSQSMIFEAYKEFLEDYLKSLEGAILPPEMLDCVMKLIIERYITKEPTFAVLSKAATTIKKDYKYIVSKISESKLFSRGQTIDHKIDRDLHSEVVLLVLRYWDKKPLTRDISEAHRPGMSILNDLLKKENQDDIADFVKMYPNDKLTTDETNIEYIAATRIQRVYKKYRLAKAQTDPKLSLVQKISAFSNLVNFSRRTLVKGTEVAQNTEQAIDETDAKEEAVSKDYERDEN